MTVEHRYVASLKDIAAVAFECKKCGARLSLASSAILTANLSACPSCSHIWMSPMLTGGRAHTSLPMAFLAALAPAVEAQDDNTVGVRILFEFAVPTP